MFVKKNLNCEFTFFIIHCDIIKNTQRYKHTEVHFIQRDIIKNTKVQKDLNAFYYLFMY